MIIIVFGCTVLKSRGKDSPKRSVTMERRRKRRSFDWPNSTWTSSRKKASLVPHTQAFSEMSGCDSVFLATCLLNRGK